MPRPIRHRAVVRVGEDALLALLDAAARGPVVVRFGPFDTAPTLSPEQTIQRVHHDPLRGTFSLLLEGPGLPEVHEGDEPPRLGWDTPRLMIHALPPEVL
jgi:hypothetical protein